MEEDKDGQETGRRRGRQESKGDYSRSGEEHWNERKGSSELLHIIPIASIYFLIFVMQFTFNPEWFEDSDEEEEGDDWDLEKYRRQKEEDDLAAEIQRIKDLELPE
jgi:hypothetical protein